MATCGYICPSCNGTGTNEAGQICDWCKVDLEQKDSSTQQDISNEQWLKQVHEGKCCSDD